MPFASTFSKTSGKTSDLIYCTLFGRGAPFVFLAWLLGKLTDLTVSEIVGGRMLVHCISERSDSCCAIKHHKKFTIVAAVVSHGLQNNCEDLLEIPLWFSWLVSLAHQDHLLSESVLSMHAISIVFALSFKLFYFLGAMQVNERCPILEHSVLTWD